MRIMKKLDLPCSIQVSLKYTVINVAYRPMLFKCSSMRFFITFINKQSTQSGLFPLLPAISTFTTQLYWKLKRNVYVTWSNCAIFWPDPLAFYLQCTFTWKLHGSRDRMDCLHVCSFAYVWVLSHGYNRILKTMVNVTYLGECCIFQWQMLSFFLLWDSYWLPGHMTKNLSRSKKIDLPLKSVESTTENVTFTKQVTFTMFLWLG